MNRDKVLTIARGLIIGQRAHDYGDAGESFQRIAKLWSATLGINIQPHEVALCLAQLKIARAGACPAHEDSWVDLAGYAALGAEIATGPDSYPGTDTTPAAEARS